jgi:hypothetical protein
MKKRKKEVQYWRRERIQEVRSGYHDEIRGDVGIFVQTLYCINNIFSK